MLTLDEHLENLTRHVVLVQAATLLLGKRLIAQGRLEFGRILIGNGFCHDNSKFLGIEWDYLHAGRDVPPECLELAWKQHVSTNPHHPEYWGGISMMPEVYIAEMVCDWYARAQEFGTGLRSWIKEHAMERFQIQPGSLQLQQLEGFVDLLLQDSFSR